MSTDTEEIDAKLLKLLEWDVEVHSGGVQTVYALTFDSQIMESGRDASGPYEDVEEAIEIFISNEDADNSPEFWAMTISTTPWDKFGG